MDDFGGDGIELDPLGIEQQLARLRRAVAKRDPKLLEDLGEVGDEVAREVAAVITDSAVDPAVRAAAAIALGPTLELCDDELIDGKLMQGPYGAPLSEPVYRRLLGVLHDLATDAGTPKLVRRRALEASVRSPQPWHERVVRWFWQSDDPELRMSAVFGMAHLYGIDFATEIGEAVEAPEKDLRAEALLAVGRRGLEAHLPLVCRLAACSTTPKPVRYAAVEALGMFGHEGDVDLLERLADDDDEIVGVIADDALENLSLFDEAEEADDEEDLEDDDDDDDDSLN